MAISDSAIPAHCEFVVEFRAPGQRSPSMIKVAYIFNCTGPEMDVTRIDSTLYKNLLKKRMIAQGDLKFGVMANCQGEIMNAEGTVQRNFFTPGGNLRGVLWETTAVPEIRQQAAAIAERILTSGQTLSR